MERKEAIEVIKKNWPDSSFTRLREALETLIPELKESEDELTWLKRFIKEEIDCLRYDIRDYEDRTKLENLQRSLSWLEKQGEQKQELLTKEKALKNSPFVEQKPAWNEEDEKMFEYALDMIEWYTGKNEDKSRHVSGWLKDLKDRVQSKQELSKEDEVTRNALINLVEMYYGGCIDKSEKNRLLSWLKSLRPQSQVEAE